MKQGNYRTLKLHLYVFDRSLRRSRTLVSNLYPNSFEVLPGTIWEVSINIVCSLRLFVSVQAFQVLWVIVFGFIIRCVLILTQNEIRDANIVELLCLRSILSRILCRYGSHYIIKTILGNHRIGINHSKQVVIKLLLEAKVCAPSLHIV